MGEPLAGREALLYEQGANRGPAKKFMKRKSASVPRPKTFDGYLAALSAPQRAALEKLRKAIRSAAPKAEECISYGVPAFRLNGKFLVALGAAANHCSFFPGSALQAFKVDLKRYDTSKPGSRSR